RMIQCVLFIHPAITLFYTLSLHDALPILMNPALESTYRFIERVVGDLVAMHREAGVPLRHIHMGGDEVPAGVWEGSPAVQAYLRSEEHRLNSSHGSISYAVFCLKKKNRTQ